MLSYFTLSLVLGADHILPLFWTFQLNRLNVFVSSQYNIQIFFILFFFNLLLSLSCTQGTNMLGRLLHVQHPTAKQAVITAIDLLGDFIHNMAANHILFVLLSFSAGSGRYMGHEFAFDSIDRPFSLSVFLKAFPSLPSLAFSFWCFVLGFNSAPTCLGLKDYDVEYRQTFLALILS